MLAKTLYGICLRDFKISSILFTQNRTRVYDTSYVKPIVDKNQLEKIKADDALHYSQIMAPDGTESPAFSFHPKLRKFMSKLMHDGEFCKGREIMDKTFNELKLRQLEKWYSLPEDKRSEVETNPLKIFLVALENCKPIVQLTPVKKAGIVYQVPVPLREKEREFKAMKLIIETCLKKDKKMRFYDRLANELLLAYNNEGLAVTKKIEMHKQAEANRAYAHYRWSK